MIIGSEYQMTELGSKIAQHLKLGDVICLRGDLGVGKSVLARSIIRTLAKDPELEVPSPSFTLVQHYDFRDVSIVHLDAYRLSGSDELWELGFPEVFSTHITLIEWPERLGELTPKRRLDIQMIDRLGDERELQITYHGDWNWRI